MPQWVTERDDGDCLVTVWVVPGASRTQVVGEHGDALKIKVTAPPEAGRANKAVLELIEGLTGARATIESGSSNRRKVVRIGGRTAQAVLDALVERQEPEAGSQKPEA